MTNRWGQVLAYATVAATTIIGIGSLLLFALFLATGGLHIVDLKMGRGVALAWDAALCLVFFIQHSGMVRRSFQGWLGQVVPAHLHRVIYTVASGAALVLLAVCWQPLEDNLLVLTGAARWIVSALALLSCAGMIWCFRALGVFDLLGTGALLAHIRQDALSETPFTVRGPYRWVRHPVYFFGIVVLWACPSISLDRLLFNALFTAWIVMGTILEERDLQVTFGQVYRDYQRKVPMLIPWP